MVKMGTVWDRTAEFLSDNIAAIVPIALLAFFVPASISGNFEAAMEGATPGLILTLRLVSLAFGILSIWGSLAISAMALDMAGESTAGTVAGRRLPAALLVAIVSFVVILALLLPVPMVLAANGVDMNAMAQGQQVTLTPALGGFVALYLLAFGIVMIWAGARLIVTTPVIVRECKGLGSLAQSWRLTRGITWRIIGVILLFAMVAGVSYLAAKTVFGSVFALVAGGGADGVSLASVLTSIVAAAVQTVFTVLVPAFTAKLYLALIAEAGLRGDAIPA